MQRQIIQSAPTDSDTLGGRMSLARDISALSIEEAAQMTGVHRDVWQAWENDRSDPGVGHIDNIAASLNVSVLWLAIGLGPGPGWPSDPSVQ
ncbi:helix-turn-helix domain-containing protein [Neorhizobium sp. LjRoot104]|uniref:helix-turn-helix domain-containing protein n=1 Tax=Neorhizobium sp. LjRoot104 TaxID=3342254 RepID=UPI003ECCEB33